MLENHENIFQATLIAKKEIKQEDNEEGEISKSTKRRKT